MRRSGTTSIVLLMLIDRATAAHHHAYDVPGTSAASAHLGVPGAACLNSTTFSGHTCHYVTNLSSSAITTSAQCVAACCATTQFTCNYVQWCDAGKQCTPGCFGGDEHMQQGKNCPRSQATTFLVNWAPQPPQPPPTPPPPKGLSLPKVIDSGMVLQREPSAARIWGWATPGDAVSATLDGKPGGSTKAGADGMWSLELKPQPASLGRAIVITSTDGGKKTLSDVAFGDVFVCSGQSHMTFSVSQDMNATTEIAASGNAPGLRMLTVNTDTATTPKDDIASVKYKSNSSWLPSQPSSFGTDDFGYPSAICYYFAKNLYHQLDGKVPVGIIMASVGGSAIHFWQSPAAIADKSCGALNLTSACPPADAGMATVTSVPATATADERAGGWTPSGFYNAMLHPLGNFALRGFLWDQGEANNADDCLVYGCKLAAFAHDLRTNLFKQPRMLFSFDQLRADPFAAGMGMQAYTSVIPHSMFSSRVDLQTCLPSDTSQGHAIRKLEVGRRLALAALVKEYGQKPTPLSFGPVITKVNAAPSKTAGVSTVTIALNYSQGLHHADVPDCPGCCKGENMFPNLIQGTPATGDAWVLVLQDGSTAAVCKNHSGCDGTAKIQDGNIQINVLTPNKPIAYVLYGGTGPWLDNEEQEQAFVPPAPKQEKCVYPHQPRFGIEACGLYNGKGGPDDHAGIAMAAQFFKVQN